MKWLSDQVVSQLQAGMHLPDLAGTRYRVLRFVARGGMGTVWLAEDTLLGRKVALKILEFAAASDELASRLAREALVLAHLEHPGIVPVHDAGALPDGRAFYCMKYVEGQTLDQFLPATLPERLRLLQRIAEPLAFAHSRGIIHRDLKPGNIMVGAFGEVLIMDWGLAKIMNDWPSEAGTAQPSSNQEPAPMPFAHELPPTLAGRVLGTPGYMSPEQARGDAELIDQRADVFALGAVLRFMLAAGQAGGVDGQRLVTQNASSQIVSKQTGGTNILMSRPLNAICEKAMAPDMAVRYLSVQELSADIGRYLEGDPVSAYREGVIEHALRLYARHRTAVVLVAAYLAMRILFILFSRR